MINWNEVKKKVQRIARRGAFPGSGTAPETWPIFFDNRGNGPCTPVLISEVEYGYVGGQPCVLIQLPSR